MAVLRWSKVGRSQFREPPDATADVAGVPTHQARERRFVEGFAPKGQGSKRSLGNGSRAAAGSKEGPWPFAQIGLCLDDAFSRQSESEPVLEQFFASNLCFAGQSAGEQPEAEGPRSERLGGLAPRRMQVQV